MSNQNPTSETILVEPLGSGVLAWVLSVGIALVFSRKLRLSRGITPRVGAAFDQKRSAA
jgi:hypothetical protein